MDLTKKPDVPPSGGFVTGRNLEIARSNSRLAVLSAVICAVVAMTGIIGSALISRTRNHVAAVPIGQTWEYPMVHWVNSPSRYEEDAKPMHVAMKYIRGLYEIDPIDFSQTSFESQTIMLSNRIAELLGYTLIGTKENLKVSLALEKSQTLFKIFSECKCVKRFLVSDMMITQPPLPSLRIEIIGRFVIFGQDGRRPLPAEDLGYKSIVLWMSNDVPIFDRESEALPLAAKVGTTQDPKKEAPTDGDVGMSKEKLSRLPKAVNPEGWYVIRSQIRTLSEKDLHDIRQLRLDAGMKGIY